MYRCIFQLPTFLAMRIENSWQLLKRNRGSARRTRSISSLVIPNNCGRSSRNIFREMWRRSADHLFDAPAEFNGARGGRQHLRPSRQHLFPVGRPPSMIRLLPKAGFSRLFRCRGSPAIRRKSRMPDTYRRRLRYWIPPRNDRAADDKSAIQPSVSLEFCSSVSCRYRNFLVEFGGQTGPLKRQNLSEHRPRPRRPSIKSQLHSAKADMWHSVMHWVLGPIPCARHGVRVPISLQLQEDSRSEVPYVGPRWCQICRLEFPTEQRILMPRLHLIRQLDSLRTRPARADCSVRIRLRKSLGICVHRALQRRCPLHAHSPTYRTSLAVSRFVGLLNPQSIANYLPGCLCAKCAHADCNDFRAL